MSILSIRTSILDSKRPLGLDLPTRRVGVSDARWAFAVAGWVAQFKLQYIEALNRPRRHSFEWQIVEGRAGVVETQDLLDVCLDEEGWWGYLALECRGELEKFIGQIEEGARC